jgi:glycosyltransferase involved in cell wall biosynthesis
MRILFVAMSQSIHTARWINQFVDQGWDINLFPSWDLTLHPQLSKISVYGFKNRPDSVPALVDLHINDAGWGLLKPVINSWIVGKIIGKEKLRRFGFGRIFDWLIRQRASSFSYSSEEERCDALVQIIQKIKPDIVHSMEIQHAGYLTLNAKKKLGGKFPTWIVTNWGADIHYFGELPEHAEKIRGTLESCDYYGCECQRDVILGRKFGFNGEIMPVITNTGGFDFEFTEQFRQPGTTSTRKIILLKGYQGWVYRALIGLQAVGMCADIIKERGYKLVIYLASSGVTEAAQELQERTGIPVELVPYTTHENMLSLHGQARVSMGFSMSDAISTSFLEAIVMGAFPIQSCTSCANEWVTSGETAFLVQPEDSQGIANALRRALLDDDLVDNAAQINGAMLRERLDYKKVQEIVVSTYEKIYKKESLV